MVYQLGSTRGDSIQLINYSAASVFSYSQSYHSISLGNFLVPCRKSEIILLNDQSQNEFLCAKLN